ncbi:MAG TPA: CBS domain-containing protein [Pararhizobium sp.]|nr:CBS domain-containing protein [Pararhizobium sp.]
MHILIERMLPVARERLVTVVDSAPLIDAARLLHRGTDIVVVSDAAGHLAGVITKGDVVNQISHCQGASCTTGAVLVMTRDVITCHPHDALEETWAVMKTRGVKNVPITDDERYPLGVLAAQDALQVLLREVEDEEALLRDYVMGIGYR